MKQYILYLLFLFNFLGGQALLCTTANDSIDNIYEKKHRQSISTKRLSNARIVMVNYYAITKKYQILKQFTNPQIDKLLLDMVAYISTTQLKDNEVNTPIPVSEDLKIGFRPLRKNIKNVYRPFLKNRSLTFEIFHPNNPQKSIGVMDVKGSGTPNPIQRHHSNGLASLGECIREYLFENLIREIFNHAKIDETTVASYAVIDAGFDIINEDGSHDRAGLYIREAHAKLTSRESRVPRVKAQKIGKLLAKYGVDPGGNVQGALGNKIVDFGHYVANDELTEIQDNLLIPFNIWGGYDKNRQHLSSKWPNAKYDNPWRWSHSLATNFANRRTNRDHVWQHFLNFMNPVRNVLSRNTRTCSNTLEKLY